MPRQRERNAIANESRKIAIGSSRFAIKLAWDGTDYQGFQSQSHGNTIQDQVEGRLQKMVRRPLRIFGWGRTDSGVHAHGAVVTVDLTHEEVARLASARTEEENNGNVLAAKTLHSALKEFACDGGLGSITAVNVVPVPGDFDPRFSSLWKRYIYFIAYGKRSPFLNRYAWQMDQTLDIDKMIRGAKLLSGKHNFEWMCISQEGELRDPIRDVHMKVEILDPGPLYSGSAMIKILGICDFFLYRMMRRIVGILVSIGIGRADEEQLAACLHAHDNGCGGSIPSAFLHTAPSKGLCLDHVEYDIPI